MDVVVIKSHDQINMFHSTNGNKIKQKKKTCLWKPKRKPFTVDPSKQQKGITSVAAITKTGTSNYTTKGCSHQMG